MTIGVYSIQSPSGKFYIGSSSNIKKRWNSYKNLRCKLQPKLYHSFLKYGVNAHVFKIEIECGFDELYEWEHHYSNYYKSVDTGLNCMIPSFKDVKSIVSKETRLKMGKSGKGRVVTSETRAKISSSSKGKIHSSETRHKLSLAHKGKKISEEQKEKLRIIKKGQKHSEETKEKIRSSTGKLILDTKTGIFYFGNKDASAAYGLNKLTLMCYLNGFRKNKTSLKYV
jgi:group I intron endonuclease